MMTILGSLRKSRIQKMGKTTRRSIQSISQTLVVKRRKLFSITSTNLARQLLNWQRRCSADWKKLDAECTGQPTVALRNTPKRLMDVYDLRRTQRTCKPRQLKIPHKWVILDLKLQSNQKRQQILYWFFVQRDQIAPTAWGRVHSVVSRLVRKHPRIIISSRINSLLRDILIHNHIKCQQSTSARHHGTSMTLKAPTKSLVLFNFVTFLIKAGQ